MKSKKHIISQNENMNNLITQMQSVGLQLPVNFVYMTPEQQLEWLSGLDISAQDTEELAQQINEFSNVQTDIIENTVQIQEPLSIGPTAQVNKFNLKKQSQFEERQQEEIMNPLDSVGFEEEELSDIVDTNFKDGAELKDWLLSLQPEQAIQNLSRIVGEEMQLDENVNELVDPLEVVKGGIQRFYLNQTNDQERLKIAMEIFDILPGSAKEEQPENDKVIFAPFKEQEIVSFVNDINKQIKKMASVNGHNKVTKASYNMKKTAELQTAHDMIMYGPSEKRIDPFLRQPVSDWTTVNRNTGFGLVVDDAWDIDWETVWRGNIMDKYSRPYRDDNGDWVGGYIQKRFEVDKWIPEENNYQLKPGQLRKPRLPEYGVIEARLEHMRKTEGENKGFGPVTSGDPFNWQKSEFAKVSSKKKNSLKEAQLAPLKDPFQYTERAPRGSKWLDPQKDIKPTVVCRMCGSELSATPPDDGKCPNCGADYNQNAITNNPHIKAPDQKGKQYNPWSNTNGPLIHDNAVLSGSNVIFDSKTNKFIKLNKSKKKNINKDDKESKTYESDEFKQLAGNSDAYLDMQVESSDEFSENDDNLNIEDTMNDLAVN